MSFENYLPLVDSDQTAALADQEYREHQARFSKQKRRDRLWELPKAVYCSVIGTCVTLEELRKISQKDKSHNYESLCDYELHKAFVSAATNKRNPLARDLQRLLEKKFQVIIRRFRDYSAWMLDDAWEEAVAAGDISGTYWALLTHPSTPNDLLDRIFGDIHMLSHISGASLRTDVRQIGRLTSRVRTLEDEIKKVRSASSNYTAKLLNEVNETGRKLKFSQDINRSLNEKLNRFEKRLNSGKYVQKEVDRLTRDLAVTRIQKERLSVKLRITSEQKQALESVKGDLEKELIGSRNEIESLESLLEQIVGKNTRGDAGASGSGELDLEQRCVLYVGGLGGQKSHYQAIVEQFNGSFLYHDGGLEHGQKSLSSALAKADVVLCPWDCVSHNATQKIKIHCTRDSTPILYLRRASTSAFLKGLEEAATN